MTKSCVLCNSIANQYFDTEVKNGSISDSNCKILICADVCGTCISLGVSGVTDNLMPKWPLSLKEWQHTCNCKWHIICVMQWHLYAVSDEVMHTKPACINAQCVGCLHADADSRKRLPSNGPQSSCITCPTCVQDALGQTSTSEPLRGRFFVQAPAHTAKFLLDCEAWQCLARLHPSCWSALQQEQLLFVNCQTAISNVVTHA